MSVYLTIPSVRPLQDLNKCLTKWKGLGYKIALLRQGEFTDLADVQIPTESYLGWARSTNILCKHVLDLDPDMTFCVGGGDDTFPDPHYPQRISQECLDHFGGTLGILQPTGDRFLWPGSEIWNFAGSPWMGREWIERSFKGNGPLSPYHFHNWSDLETQKVAERLGMFWQRDDLIHRHEHWMRQDGGPKPAFWDAIGAEYHSGRALYETRKAAGWPGSELLTC